MVDNHTDAKTIKVIGFGPRFAATIIDGVLLGALSLLLGAMVGMLLIVLEFYAPSETLPVDALIILSGLLLSVIYYTSAWVRSGQTPGKRIIGVRVVGSQGQTLTWGEALVRYVGYLVSAVALSLGFLWVVFDRKRQGWHDKLAKTYVVDEGASLSATDQVNFEPADPKLKWGWLVVWIVIAITAPALLIGGLVLLNPYLSKGLADLLRGVGL